MNGNKGQLSIVNMIFFVFIVAVGVVLTPVMIDFIDTTIDSNNITGMSAIIMQAIVPLFWIGIIATFFLYINPIGNIRQY